MRIASLLPSATDIVVALGGARDIVAVSHSCTGDWDALPKLTSTWVDDTAASAEIDAQVRTAEQPLYELDVSTLERLDPDVIISQSLCEVCAVPSGDVLEAVQSLPGRPTLVDMAPARLEDMPNCFNDVGAAIGRQAEAVALVDRWWAEFERHHDRFAGAGLKVAFLDWIDPPFAAGHWIPDMLDWLGVESALATPDQPSHCVSWEDVRAASPDLIVAACCGLGADRAKADAGRVDLPIVCLDGHELFSRPSPALIPSLAVLSDTIACHQRDG